jgi:hypothetical protein
MKLLKVVMVEVEGIGRLYAWCGIRDPN